MDFKTQTGFVGLPPEWAVLLRDAQITAKDFEGNEEEAVNEMVGLMQFFTEEVQGGGGGAPAPTPIPEGDANVKLEDLVNPSSPEGIYKDMVEIGVGAAGTVYSAVDTRRTDGFKVSASAARSSPCPQLS